MGGAVEDCSAVAGTVGVIWRAGGEFVRVGVEGRSEGLGGSCWS
jgi:hypothetical protein